jgi:hypothetical protein
MRLRRLTALLMAAGGMAAATQAQAQSAATEARRERAPIRASATVEVIDSARGIDDIISRVRDQRDRRAAAANKERTKTGRDDRTRDSAAGAKDGDRAKAAMEERKDTTDSSSMNRDDDDKRGGASSGTGASGDRDQLRPDKNDRPNPRADRDRREPRRQDSDTRQTQPRDRARWNHR